MSTSLVAPVRLTARVSIASRPASRSVRSAVRGVAEARGRKSTGKIVVVARSSDDEPVDVRASGRREAISGALAALTLVSNASVASIAFADDASPPPPPAPASKPKILVIGATGQTGQLVVDELRKRGGADITAAVRSPEKATKLGIDEGGVALLPNFDVTAPADILAERMKNTDVAVVCTGFVPGNPFKMSQAAHAVDNEGCVHIVDAAKAAGVKRVVQTVMLPWLNTLVLFNQSVVRMTAKSGIAFAPDRARVASSSNAMDRWVMATLQQLIAKVRAEMAAYNLFNVVPPLVDFIGSLTNWYLRLNRFRLKGKGAGGAEEQLTALCTLYDVLLDLSVLMGPATPFFAEFVYQSMRLHHPLYAADAAAASAADGVAVDALGRSESVRVAVVSILLFALFFCCSPILLFALYSFVCSLYSRCTTS